MKNITQEIEKAFQLNYPWSFEQFYLFIENAEQLGIEISYWENEENWASAAFNHTPIGYIWKKYPLIFIVSEVKSIFYKLLDNFDYVIIIEVADLSSDELIIESKSDIVDRLGSLGYNEPISASEIWFCTVN